MKKYLSLISLVCCLAICSCGSDDDEMLAKDASINLQNYKWVCRTSDEPLIGDDNQWAIFDDYVFTLYFVSDYECVIRYLRKHFDTDDGTSYERGAQTVKYMLSGNNIILDRSDYTDTEFIYEGDFLSSGDLIYEKEELIYSDMEWIDENFKHIELDPDESTSTAFKGLKEIYDNSNSWEGIMFGNPHCDEKGRLTYYKTKFDRNKKYEYYNNTIISKIGKDNEYIQNTYTLTNGLITSFISQSYYEDQLEYTFSYDIKYDSNNRIIQIICCQFSSKTTYNFKWNSSGDLYESDICYSYDGGEPSYIHTYEYLPSDAQIPCLYLGSGELLCPFNLSIDPILVMEGYYGNSIPKHNLKSIYTEMSKYNKPYERYNWSYSFDSKARITRIVQEYKDLYDNGDRDRMEFFTLKWE